MASALAIFCKNLVEEPHMPPQPAIARENLVPLCVDLDGTLIKTDLLWESFVRALRRNPLYLFAVPFWWARGRAFLKRQLAERVQLDFAALPYNEPFLAFLRERKRAGQKLVLTTASDSTLAKGVADYVGIFDEVLASDGQHNLRGKDKARTLAERFGERGFDYAGNSSVDLPVWGQAREAIVVNASDSLAEQASRCAKLGRVFKS
jgi:phosphoserine phosphatase